MLSEVSQTEKNKPCMTTRIHGIFKKKPKLIRSALWLPEMGVGEGKLNESGQKVQTSSYKINKY